MKEIGGYLELEHYTGKEYHQLALRFNTVRNSIEYLLKERQYTKIFIPWYLCNSISDMLNKISFDFEYYNIDESFCPILDQALQSHEVILIVNYYGLLDNAIIKKFKDRYSNIILDNTHAFFQNRIEYIDTVYTCRKFFGVSDGAYLYTDMYCPDYDLLDYDLSATRMGHLLGRFEQTATQYYNEFKKNDNMLSGQEIKKMSKLTQNILKSIDYNAVRARRKENFNYLHKKLEEKNKIHILQKGEYMYPLLLHNGSEIKKYLISNHVYIPTLWPNVLQNCSKNSWEYYLSENLILLPIDQRYTSRDMQYIIDLLEKHVK